MTVTAEAPPPLADETRDRLAVRLIAGAHVVEDSAGVVAATHLLCEYSGGRLLDRQDLRDQFLRPHGSYATVNWPHLADVLAQEGSGDPSLPLGSGERAALHLAAALATNRPISHLGAILAKFDLPNAAVVLRAVYAATHHGTPPPLGWPELADLIPTGEASDPPFFQQTREAIARAADDPATDTPPVADQPQTDAPQEDPA